jgi:sugar/nucleoside kinase (ribokinase family)
VSPSVPEVACVGDNCVDVCLDAGGMEPVGGSALNVALELARAGHATAYLGAVGTEPRGQMVLAGAHAGAEACTRVGLAGDVPHAEVTT